MSDRVADALDAISLFWSGAWIMALGSRQPRGASGWDLGGVLASLGALAMLFSIYKWSDRGPEERTA